LSSGVFQQIVMASLKTTAFITTILIGAKFFSQVLRQVGGDEVIAQAFGGLNLDRYVMLAVLILIVFLLGFVLDWIEITLIVLPLFKPVVLALGFEINGFGLDNAVLVWFALLVAIALQTSFLSPPVGFALFYLKGVCPPEVKLTDIYKGVIPFIILQLATLLVVIKWPELVTWLPSVKYGH
jgi:TRAP-type mannitol/chloroaromatic compound transport system permease large subunit